jgi:hypothetical protein
MIKKTLTYTDYDGIERTETHYFNLNKAELHEMQHKTQGGFVGYVQKISETQDIPKLVELFKDLILRSHGSKSLDGKRFIKDPEFTKEFTQTEAYVNLYMELSSDADRAVEFVKGILPVEVNQIDLNDPAFAHIKH